MNWLMNLYRSGLSCMFHALTGLYCPGCGGTRAVLSLLKGDLRMSVQYHPLVPYTVFIILLEIVIRAVYKRNGRTIDHKKRVRIFILAGAAIVVVNWFFKNYMLVFQGVDLLPAFS